MGIGPKIKEFRLKNELTQKDLAEKLSVTYQAVSRWENDEAEPSFDTLKQMCTLFNCTTDDLFSMEKEVVIPKKEEEKKEEIIETQTKVETPKEPVMYPIDRCSKCGKNIYDSIDLIRKSYTNVSHVGRTTHKEVVTKVLCKSCNDKEIKAEKERKRLEELRRKEELKRRRIHSFVWPGIIIVICVIISITKFNKGDTTNGVYTLVGGIGLGLFLANVILNNNFITEMWLTVSSWGFVKLPGLIFSLSLDGIIWFLTVKLLFWVLGILLAICATIFATILAMALSVFVYPFALYKNIKCIE